MAAVILTATIPPSLASPLWGGVTAESAGLIYNTRLAPASLGGLFGGLFGLGTKVVQDTMPPVDKSLLPNTRPRPPHTKAEREAKVSSIQINPESDVVLESRQPLVLAAVPLDEAGNPIHGLTATWESNDRNVVFVTKAGYAVAGKPGKAKLTAAAGNKKASLKVTVVTGSLEPFGGKKKDSKRETASTRKVTQSAAIVPAVWSPDEGSFFTGRARDGETAPVAKAAFEPRPFFMRPVDEDPLPDGETGSLYQPGNATGSPPGRTTPGSSTPPAADDGTESPGTANFNFQVPVADLPGRGLNVSLGLVYNSRVWNKSNAFGSTYFTYDVDSGWPAPGFRLGYGQMESQGSQGFTLTDSDGTRHQLVKTNPSNQYDYRYEATDGTFVTFYGGRGWGTATYPDGTRVEYGAASTGPRSFPTRVIDRNGNYILISYVGGVGPRISTIQDTMGRFVRFYYDGGGDLVAVTVPGYEGGSDRQTIRLYYETISVVASFTSGGSAPSSSRVVRYVYLPGTQTGYRYDYSTYGMIYRTTELRGMSVNYMGLDQTGAVTSEGQQAAWTVYNYPTGPSNLSDVPNYTRRTDDWAGRTTGMNGTAEAPYTSFAVTQETGFTVSTVTAPDGTTTETRMIASPGAWNDGLLDETIVKQGTSVLGRVKTQWELGPSGRNARPLALLKTNEAGQTKAVVYTYTDYNNVSVTSERDITTDGTAGPELRRTEVDYETRAEWTSRGLVRLPVQVRVIAGGTIASRTDYAYDTAGTNLTRRDDIIMHDASYDPYAAPQENCYWQERYDCYDYYGYGCNPTYDWVCDTYYIYDPATDKRGNVTSVTRYTDAAAGTGAVTETTGYDIAGNIVSASADCCRQKTFTYSKTYEYAYPTSFSRGDAGQLTAGGSFDFNTGLLRTSTDENGQTTTVYYFPESLRHAQTNRPDGSYVYTRYNDTLSGDPDAGHMNSWVFTGRYEGPGQEVSTYTFLDGRGATVRSFNSTSDGWETIDAEYDVVGRPYRRSNPYYSSGSGSAINPAGLWTTATFDALSRARAVTLPDGTVSHTDYSGMVVTATDEAGKTRRSLTDALGRVKRVDEPDANGNLGSVDAPAQPTSYAYDGLDKVVHVTQGVQHRYFKYDSLGRLTHERHPEQDAPHYAPDSLTGNSQWSRYFVYDGFGLVSDTYDARGVNTHFVYDGLNRVSQATYSDGTPSVTYHYDQAHTSFYNNGRLTEVITTNGGAQETAQQYDYDSTGRIVSHRQILGSPANGTATTYSMAYTYDGLGQLASQTYPSGRVVSYGHDNSGRLTSIADGNRTYASGFSYGPHGGLLSETWGNGAVHTMGYNSRLQLNQIRLVVNGAEQQRYDYAYGQINPDTGAVDASKNNGQIARIEGFINGEKQWQQRFSYDQLGRLSLASEWRGDDGTLTQRVSYDYDAYGNRYQNQGLNYNVAYTPVTSPDIDQGRNRFTNGVQYDAAGNIIADNKFRGMNFFYDANGRVRNAYRTDGTGGTAAVYDATGQKVQTTTYGVTRRVVYDIAGLPVSEYSAGLLDRENIYRGGQLLATDEQPRACSVSVEQFIRNVFQGSLGRQPYDAELQNWMNRLSRAQSQGYATLLGEAQQLGQSLFTSTEYINRNRSDGDYVTDLYWSYLQRGPDQGGWNFWTSVVPSDGRTNVRYGFANSTEFQNKVSSICPTTGNGGVRYVMMDHQGSPRVMMNNNGASSSIVARRDYLPFGEEVWAGTGKRTAAQGYGATYGARPGFALTERDDDTGLLHTWWRKYDTMSGRWTTPDPYKGSFRGEDPQTLNRYTYVGNDPVNRLDPTGLLCYGFHVFLLHFENGRLTSVDYLGFLVTYCDGGGGIVETRGGGGGGGGGGNPGGQRGGGDKAKFSEDKLKQCAHDLFGVDMKDFKPSRDGHNGSFTGEGSYNPTAVDNRNNPERSFGPIFVVNEVNAYNQRRLSQIAGDADNTTIGATFYLPNSSYSPYRNFTASDLTNPTAILAVQVHELGNSLSMITGKSLPPPAVPGINGDKDAGVTFERCVFGGDVTRNGGLIKR